MLLGDDFILAPLQISKKSMPFARPAVDFFDLNLTNKDKQGVNYA